MERLFRKNNCTKSALNVVSTSVQRRDDVVWTLKRLCVVWTSKQRFVRELQAQKGRFNQYKELKKIQQ